MLVRANITTAFAGRGYTPVEVPTVSAYEIDSSLDTDTDSWTIEIGDVDLDLADVLQRDNEVRMAIYGIGDATVETLHSGFADEILFDHERTMTISGRDITSVAVDSKHPPQIWTHLRPKELMESEARALGIGGALRCVSVNGFKKGSTDGSENYWEVWYRFYRKRQKWIYAEPDGTLVADTLRYESPISYYFGWPSNKISGVAASDWLPIERLEWRANKQQRIAEVYVFGHRGDVGFVGQGIDPSMAKWIKRPRQIIQDTHAHNKSEAVAEALEELFESKVGATEIKIMIFDPGQTVRQNTMAYVNVPEIDLEGEFFVVGTRILGSIDEGMYQEVRLREKNFAISRRVPDDPVLNAGTGQGTPGDIASNITGDVPWKQFFVDAALKFHGPWNFQVFLGVLLAICEQETGFRNVRRGGHTIYPGTRDRHVPSIVTENGAFQKFATEFANERKFGRVNEDFAVGPMQLLSVGYKYLADRAGGTSIDELIGGRWSERWNIWAAGAALAEKLGAGWSVDGSGNLRQTQISGASLDPREQNIWIGVGNYGEGAKYAREVRTRYEGTYKPMVADAIDAANAAAKAPAPEGGGTINSISAAELRKRVLENSAITFTRASQRDDIRYGLVTDDVLRFLLYFTAAGFPVTITALRSDHNTYTTGGNVSAHSAGKAVDLGNYGISNSRTRFAMQWIAQYQPIIGFKQLIGPIDSLVIPLGWYDAETLREHDTHIHVGW